jgi:hypothetical protein
MHCTCLSLYLVHCMCINTLFGCSLPASKVGVTKNEVGQEGDYSWASVWDCGDQVSFAIWTYTFCVKNQFPFPLAASELRGDCFYNRHGKILSEKHEWLNWCLRQYIGKRTVHFLIGKVDLSRMCIQTIEILRIFWGFTWHYSKSQLDAPIYLHISQDTSY